MTPGGPMAGTAMDRPAFAGARRKVTDATRLLFPPLVAFVLATALLWVVAVRTGYRLAKPRRGLGGILGSTRASLSEGITRWSAHHGDCHPDAPPGPHLCGNTGWFPLYPGRCAPSPSSACRSCRPGCSSQLYSTCSAWWCCGPWHASRVTHRGFGAAVRGSLPRGRVPTRGLPGLDDDAFHPRLPVPAWHRAVDVGRRVEGCSGGQLHQRRTACTRWHGRRLPDRRLAARLAGGAAVGRHGRLSWLRDSSACSSSSTWRSGSGEPISSRREVRGRHPKPDPELRAHGQPILRSDAGVPVPKRQYIEAVQTLTVAGIVVSDRRRHPCPLISGRLSKNGPGRPWSPHSRCGSSLTSPAGRQVSIRSEAPLLPCALARAAALPLALQAGLVAVSIGVLWIVTPGFFTGLLNIAAADTAETDYP